MANARKTPKTVPWCPEYRMSTIYQDHAINAGLDDSNAVVLQFAGEEDDPLLFGLTSAAADKLLQQLTVAIKTARALQRRQSRSR